MRKHWIVLPALLALALVFGCAKPPQADIDAAKAAIEAARNAGAGEYAASSLSAADDQVAQLEAELTAQQGKFALTRSYKKATEIAAAAKAAGEKAAADAAAGKEAARTEATALIEQAKVVLAEATTALEGAPKGKGTQADLEVMKADLASVATTIADAEASLSGERYLEAKSKAQAAISSAGNVKTAVEQAIAAKAGRR